MKKFYISVNSDSHLNAAIGSKHNFSEMNDNSENDSDNDFPQF
jgi:hypothetical protein